MRDAMAKLEQREREAAIRLEQAQREAMAELDSVERDADARIAQLERELTAERQSALALVDRRTFLERELSDARTSLGPMEARADIAERRAAELDVQLELANERVQDLEATLAVEKTASQSSVDEARAAADAAVAEARAAFDTATAESRAELHEAREQLAAARADLADTRERLDDAEGHARNMDVQLKVLVAKAEQADNAILALDKLAAAEDRVRDLEAEVRDLEADIAEHSTAVGDDNSKLSGALERISELEQEVANAENVRQFAAATEREIAQLQRELREAKKQVEQLTKDLRARSEQGDETTGKRAPIVPFDPEVTAQADLGKYEQMIARSKEQAERAARIEREDADLRRKLAETEAKLRAAMDMAVHAGDSASRTIPSMPAALAEPLAILEESIDSLRAEMRAASDEAAEMTPTPSVQAISGAVGNAIDHLDRAKQALRALMQIVEG